MGPGKFRFTTNCRCRQRSSLDNKYGAECLRDYSIGSTANNPMVERGMGRQADHNEIERALTSKLHDRRCCMTGDGMTM